MNPPGAQQQPLQLPDLTLERGRDIAELPQVTSRCRAWGDDASALAGTTGLSGRRLVITVQGVVSFLFDRQTPNVLAVPARGIPAATVVDIYRRVALPLILQARGVQVIHASANMTPSGILLLCGEARAGKSTICFGLARRGYRPFADDAVAFAVIEDRVFAYRLDFRLRLRPDAVGYFLSSDAAGHRSQSQEAGTFESSTLKSEEPVGSPVPVIVGMLLERISGGAAMTTGPIPNSPDLLAALLRHAYCFSRDSAEVTRQMIDDYVGLARALPFARFPLGSGLDGFEDRIDAIEALIASDLQQASPRRS